ncbi:hypothetical protein NEPAR06_2132 [Nematocida parisii]|uniref:uncharacterized protein n=1 Tax=Nematocida parisii (strain ERTm1 / ATCC PRA-289) TaxID=881290 RepID=UPI000264B1BB|nr:uncharacterized protein NEPG_00979 [Nematocida parisii ERTm1]EIJ94311.1 hypothetical protein NEPG_00979 [Nematocida parisii ERTm1]KAI5156094.1 hypothetical protein NEPAR06_2132 [Nematocida parisii]KAI5158691.1 hypothetical protein NEPAR05_2217 [Nematocida parisii]|eukprot:XP_013058807.1 hypothetical protein NEPG_00979 [Nematocida parisii ERTm1]
MLITTGRSVREVVADIIETYSKERRLNLTKENKEYLLRYLLPYTKQSLNIPSTHEIKELSEVLLHEQDHRKIEALLVNSTVEIRKAVYFMLKIKKMGLILSNTTVDSEEMAFSVIKNASVGIYMSWFKDIADGNGSRLKNLIPVGLFDMCFTVYCAGKVYLYLEELCFNKVSPLAQSFFWVVKSHLNAYRESIYTKQVDSMFSFYVKHYERMKWLHRLAHISQEVLMYDEGGMLGGIINKNKAGADGFIVNRKIGNRNSSLIEFIEKLRESPWTESISNEILERYKKPLSDEVIKWMEGYSSDNSFIKENKEERNIWNVFSVVERDIPLSLSINTARNILYIGKTKRILPMLKSFSTLEFSGSIPDSGIFDSEWIDHLHKEAEFKIKSHLFLDYKAYEHLKMIRDVFFLFRSDFAHGLVNLLDGSEYGVDASAVDEILDGCFGHNVTEFVDVIIGEDGLSLVYKEVFPYNVIFGSISQSILSGFELFWNLRKVICGVFKLYKENKSPSTFLLSTKAGEIEYYYFEKIVHALWCFKDMPEESLYNPGKISKKVEDILYHLINTCKETCTLSILRRIQELLIQPITTHSISAIETLLQRISGE